MSTLSYVGAPATNPNDIDTQGYVASLLAQNLSQSSIDSLMTSGFAPYVLKSYVDAQDALNATKAYIDAGDATRLHLSQKGVNNGIAPLDATGRIPSGRIAVASTQRWPKPFVSPAAYHSAPVAASTAETTVYSMSIADPGFTYKIFVTGLLDLSSSVEGEYGIVNVRAANATTGDIVAVGRGLSESYFISPNGGTDTFGYTANALNSSDWTLSDETGVPGAGEIAANGSSAYYRQINGNQLIRRALRANSADATTATDFQQMTVNLSATQQFSNDVNEFYLRVNSAFTHYVKLRIIQQGAQVQWEYNNGGGEVGGQIPTSMSMASTDVYTIIAGANSTTRKYDFLKNGTSITSFTDTTNTVVDSSHRRWAFGMGTFGGGGNPAQLDSITIGDGVQIFNAGPALIIPTDLANQSARTGATTIYVRLTRSGSTSTQTASTYKPQLWAMPVPA